MFFWSIKKSREKKKRAKSWPRASSRLGECGPEAKPMLLTMFFFFIKGVDDISSIFFLNEKKK